MAIRKLHFDGVFRGFKHEERSLILGLWLNWLTLLKPCSVQISECQISLSVSTEKLGSSYSSFWVIIAKVLSAVIENKDSI